MYSPQLSEETVHKLWKLKQLCKRPMTKLAEELIQRGLEGFVQEAEARLNSSISQQEHGNGDVKNNGNGKAMAGIQITGTRGW